MCGRAGAPPERAAAGSSDRRDTWPPAWGRATPPTPRDPFGRLPARLSGRPSSRLPARLSTRRSAGRTARRSGDPSARRSGDPSVRRSPDRSGRCVERPSARCDAVGGGPAVRGPVRVSGPAPARGSPPPEPLRCSRPTPGPPPDRSGRVSCSRDDGDEVRCAAPDPDLARVRCSGVPRAPRSGRPAIRASYGTRSPRLLSSTGRTALDRPVVSLTDPAARCLASTSSCGGLGALESAGRSPRAPDRVPERLWGDRWLDRACDVRMVSTPTRVDDRSDADRTVGGAAPDLGLDPGPESAARAVSRDGRSGRGGDEPKRPGRDTGDRPRSNVDRSSPARAPWGRAAW